jgi:glutamine amidotransferase
MVAIVDYGVGNLFSCRARSRPSRGGRRQRDAAVLRRADRILLPGVGAFGDAAEKLRRTGLDRAVVACAAAGTPLLGVAWGCSILFEKSYEFGEHDGLGLIPGCVRPIAGVIPADLKIPQIGWNSLQFRRPSPLFRYIKNGDYVYFVHSYYATDCDESTIAVTDYGAPLPAAVQRGSVFGCQFHPEKSGTVGLAILRAFCEEVGV